MKFKLIWRFTNVDTSGIMAIFFIFFLINKITQYHNAHMKTRSDLKKCLKALFVMWEGPYFWLAWVARS